MSQIYAEVAKGIWNPDAIAVAESVSDADHGMIQLLRVDRRASLQFHEKTGFWPHQREAWDENGRAIPKETKAHDPN